MVKGEVERLGATGQFGDGRLVVGVHRPRGQERVHHGDVQRSAVEVHRLLS
jgi:hypothetical protein